MRTLNNFILERLECPKLSILEHLKLTKNTKLKETDYVDLGLPSGALWATSNVGATCGSKAKSWYGDYFMWGDTVPATNKICNWENYRYCNGKHNYLTKYCYDYDCWDGPGDPDNKLDLELMDDMVHANLSGKWRMPNYKLIDELIHNTTYEWVTNYKGISNLDGSLLTSKKNGNTIFFPASGYRDGSIIYGSGFCGFLWSSKLVIDDTTHAYNLYIDNDMMCIHSGRRDHGKPIRGVLK